MRPTSFLTPEQQARFRALRSELWELLKTGDPADPDHNLDIQMVEEELEELTLEEFRAWLRNFRAAARFTPRRNMPRDRRRKFPFD